MAVWPRKTDEPKINGVTEIRPAKGPHLREIVVELEKYAGEDMTGGQASATAKS